MMNSKLENSLQSSRHLPGLSIILAAAVGGCTLYILFLASTPSIEISSNILPLLYYNESTGLCCQRKQNKPCSWVNFKRNHSRYLIVGPITLPREGIGNTVGHVVVFLQMAVKYDLHLVFRGNITMDRQGERINIKDTFGFTASSVAFSSEDPILKELPVRRLPIAREKRNRILKDDININTVVYDPGTELGSYLQAHLDMYRPIKNRVAKQDAACTTTGQILQQLFWNAPSPRHCSVFPSMQHDCNRFHIAVHIRRGDVLPKSTKNPIAYRNLDHCYYVSTAEIAIRALRKLVNRTNGYIYMTVFSDSPGDSLLDEYGDKVNMENDVKRVCDDVAVKCKFSLVLAGDPLQAIQCFAMADLFIGSKSLFSLVGGILNRNIKLLANYQSTDMPNAVTIDSDYICSNRNSTQRKLDEVVREWSECRNQQN